MSFGFNGYWYQLQLPDLEWAARNLLPETPKEIMRRVEKTKGWTLPVPLPRGLGSALERFDW